MNGYQLCKEIKENLNISHIPVILLTARADSESQMLGYKLGADAYLPKPFEMEMLLSVIQNQMEIVNILNPDTGAINSFCLRKSYFQQCG